MKVLADLLVFGGWTSEPRATFLPTSALGRFKVLHFFNELFFINWRITVRTMHKVIQFGFLFLDDIFQSLFIQR